MPALVLPEINPYAPPMASTGRPTVFVSSTVFDFRDLRSALKYWLTELGYDPRLSDFNDFPKPLDTNSYDACLKTIADADYFVLLIGSRVGGWYSEPDKISITRQEYRHAYDSFVKTGRPQIVTFVRGEVWNVKDDRADLARLLEKDAALQKDVSPDVAAKITNASSRHVNDAEAIFAFIDEVKRKEEMIIATRKGEGFPPGNWVHSFTSFADVIDVMRTQVRSGSVRRAALVANLRQEIIAIADELLVDNNSGGKTLLARYVGALVKRYVAAVPPSEDDVSLEALQQTRLDLSETESRQLAFFMIVSGSGRRMRTAAIEQAIGSGEFLRWESSVHAFVPTVVQHALLRLREEIEALRISDSIHGSEMYREWSGPVQAGEATTLSLYQFVPVVSLHNRHENIAYLTAALQDHFTTGNEDALKRLRLWSTSAMSVKREPLHAGVSGRVRVATWQAEVAAKLKAPATPPAAPSSPAVPSAPFPEATTATSGK